MAAHRPPLALALLVALLLLEPACLAAAEESRTYHSLWGGLFKQQQQQQASQASGGAASGVQAMADGFKETMADLHAKLLVRLGDHGIHLSSSSGGDGDAGGSPEDSGGGDSGGGEATSLLRSLLLGGSTHSGGNTSSDTANQTRSAGSTHWSFLEDYFAAHVNLTLSLLDQGADSTSLLRKLHEQLALDWSKADAQQLATIAAVQGWALGALLAGGSSGGMGLASGRSGGGGGGLSGSGSGGGGLSGGMGLDQGSKRVLDPAWHAFKGHTCLRLQNFGNAEGYNIALFGANPCSGGGSAAPAVAASGGNAAASGDALRWGNHAAFLLDCSKGSGSGSSSGGRGDSSSSSGADAAGGGSSALSGSGGGGGTLSGMLHAAASKAAASVAAAMDSTSVCRLAVSTDGGGGSGGGALLEHAFERPLLLGVPQMDALRIRMCNMAPSTLQYPAALARGNTIRLASLKLNGRPLLPAALQASQATAADGCLVQLYRLSSKATKGGYVLSGWVQLTEGGGSGGGVAMASSGGMAGFGVGEMASVEISLGEYSLLDAAASRLLGGGGSASSAAAQQAAAPLP